MSIGLPPYPQAGRPVTADWGRRVINYLRALTPRGGGGVVANMTPSGTTYSLTRREANRRGFPFGALHPFGIATIDGAVVTVAPGALQRGAATDVFSSETDITVAQDGYFIGLEYDPLYATLTVIGQSTKPVVSGGKWRTWLYSFGLVTDADDANPVAVLSPPHNLTGIRLDAVYGAEADA